jgi:hypothetical protein
MPSQAGCVFGGACSFCQDPLPFAECSEADMSSGEDTADAAWEVHDTEFVLIGILKSGGCHPAVKRCVYTRCKSSLSVKSHVHVCVQCRVCV